LAHAERLRALAFVVLTPGAVEYRGWSDGSNVEPGVWTYPSGVRIDLGDPSDWPALMHYWRFSLTRLAERYVAGEANVDPLPFECTTCHLSTFGRIKDLGRTQPEREFTPEDMRRGPTQRGARSPALVHRPGGGGFGQDGIADAALSATARHRRIA